MRQCPTCGTNYWGDSDRSCVTDGAVLQEVIVGNDRTRLLGSIIHGRYQIDGVLGDGGMGVVYRATGLADHKPYAVKVLRAEYSSEPDLVARFEVEAKAVANIQHPHIVKVFEFGALEDGSRFFVMEYLEGKPLGQVMHNAGRGADGVRRPLDIKLALHIALQICSGLQAAHDTGTVHRDMKPDNVHLVREGDDAAFVKVLDFGIAKVLGSQAAKTRTGSVFGTPQYMSPEQANGESNMDARTDVYAVGILLYEMVCGRLPFDAENLMGILAAHMYQPAIPPRSLPSAKQVTPALEAVILKALSKDRTHRYQSMNEFAADIRRVAEGEDPNAFDDAVPTIVQGGGRSSLAPPAPLAPHRASYRPPANVSGPQPTMSPVSGPASQVAQPRTNPLVFALAGVGIVGFLAAGYVAFTRSRAPRIDDDLAHGVTIGPSTQLATPDAGVMLGSVPSANIHIVTSPPGAQLMMGTQLLCQTPCNLPRPSTTAVMYTVTMEGYQRSTFAVEPQSPEAIQLMLPARQRGSATAPRNGSGSRSTTPTNGAADPPQTGNSGINRTTPLRNPWD